MVINNRLQVHIINDRITAVIDGQLYTCDKSHKNFDRIMEAIKSQSVDELPDLFSLARAVNNYVSHTGRLKVEDSKVYYREGKDRYAWYRLEFSFVEHLLEMMEYGFPIEAFVNYIERVMKNPNRDCIEELHPFITRGQDVTKYLPILMDGRFIAYKRVREDYLDYHSRTIDWIPLHRKYAEHPNVGDRDWLLAQPGHRIGSPRWCVDPNIYNQCSTGYHVGRYEYIMNFHQYDKKSHILKVACDPSQVVAANREGSMKKVRMHVVEVREEITAEELQIFCGEKPPTPKLPPIPTSFGSDLPDSFDNYDEAE